MGLIGKGVEEGAKLETGGKRFGVCPQPLKFLLPS